MIIKKNLATTVVEKHSHSQEFQGKDLKFLVETSLKCQRCA